jgi:serine/arginine repetitive matrix protein 1
VSAEQDSRFGDKEKRLLKKMTFPKEFAEKADLSRVNWEVLKPWIAKRITELLGGVEDDVLIGYICGQVEGQKRVDPRVLQINLTGFLEKNTSLFCKELWGLLLSAARSPSGIPQQFLDAKAAELQAREAETRRMQERMAEERRRQEELRAEQEAAARREWEVRQRQAQAAAQAAVQAQAQAAAAHAAPARGSSRSRSPGRERRRRSSRSGSRERRHKHRHHKHRRDRSRSRSRGHRRRQSRSASREGGRRREARRRTPPPLPPPDADQSPPPLPALSPRAEQTQAREEEALRQRALAAMKGRQAPE